MTVDLYFTYKHTLRFLLMHKAGGFVNTHQIPKVKQLLIYFYITDLENLDDPRVYNYYYFLKFFFGKRAFFIRYKTIFSLNKYYYNFNVAVIFRGNSLYYPIYFLLNDIKPFIAAEYFTIWGENNYYYISIKDMSIFMEKKTNQGLFNLKDPLMFKFNIVGGDTRSQKLLLDCFKLYV